MKTHGINRLMMLILLISGWITAYGQQQMEVPGDNFSLEGALELFKKSASPQEFEKMLNDADARVNNLDLNGDGYIDYIRVIDYNEGNVHAFVMQAAISKYESQDIAVITLEKLGNGKAVLQITGDADIYGVETIIEPTREVRTYGGTTSRRFAVNVWAWPSVRYIYGPYYSVWISPWGWDYRPHWWHTWRPVVYYDYYSYWNPYRVYYSPCYSHRVVYAHHIYMPHRTTSVIVHHNHGHRIANYRSAHISQNGEYRHNTGRSGTRQTTTAVRYDANGRIRSASSPTTRSGSITSTRSQTRDLENNSRSSRTQDYNASGNRTSSGISRNGSSSNSTNSRYEGRATATPNASRSNSGSSASVQRSPLKSTDVRTSSGNSGIQRSTGSSNVQPSTGSSGIQRSTGSPSVQRSTGSSGIQRSTGSPSVQRSTGSSGIQRSTGSPSVQRSTGSSGVQRSTGSSNVQRSTGSSGIQRSTGSSGVQRSTGSPSVQRSTGSSSIQRSTGSSSVQRSSGSSSIQRSSGSSNAQRSSGNTSAKTSSSRSSSTSSQNNRGRH